MPSLIELRGIRKTYSDGHAALRDIDLSLGEGMFGLLGPNGAGKTTLLSTLVLALEPTAGLDPEERIHFRNLIAEVAEEVAVLLSTHIAEDIEATCNRIAVLADGVFTFDGSVDALLGRGGRAGSLEEAYAAELLRHGGRAA